VRGRRTVVHRARWVGAEVRGSVVVVLLVAHRGGEGDRNGDGDGRPGGSGSSGRRDLSRRTVVAYVHRFGADGVDASFVPAFAESAGPQDFWHIDAVYLDPRWLATQSPLADFAVARVSRQDGGSVEAAVGGGLTIGSSPPVGTDVVVTGYPLGVGGAPVGCAADMAALERGYPSIRCAGLVDGTSGAPWLSASTVVGITGGLDGGGCEQNVSYAPPFDGAIKQLITRAEAGGPGDAAPSAFEDDC
jgi:hypothetical protein